MSNQITFSNRAQAAIFENEIKGQISDGMWENTNGTDWETWCDTKVEVGPNTGRRGYVRKTGFAIERLIPIIGDRMMTYAKIAIAFPDADIADGRLFEYALTPVETLNKYAVQSEFWQSILDHLVEVAAKAGIAPTDDATRNAMDGQKIVRDAVASVDYDEKALRRDVKEMKATMKKTWKPVEVQLAAAATETETLQADLQIALAQRDEARDELAALKASLKSLV